MKTDSVAIVGGGPAGAVAAIELALAGFSVSVYEAFQAAQAKIGETLPPTAIPMLRRLGLLRPDFGELHLQSHGIRLAWGSDEPKDRDFLFERYGPGWRLDRRQFDAGLAQIACQNGAEWHVGSTVRFPRLSRGRWRFLVNGSEQSADALIDATGRRCAIARALGSRRLLEDRLAGVAVLYESETKLSDTFTLIEAVPDGWWYSGVLPDGKLMVVRFTDTDLPCFRQARESSGFDQLLRCTRLTVDRVRQYQYRASKPPIVLAAGGSRLDNFGCDRWLAAGDAAAAFDPLSSHGILHAIGSGYYCARALFNASAMKDYAAAIEDTWSACQRGLSTIYGQEQRWSKERFWLRRQSGQALNS